MPLTDYPNYYKDLIFFTKNFTRPVWLTKSGHRVKFSNISYRVIVINTEVNNYQLSKTAYSTEEQESIFNDILAEYVKSGNADKVKFYRSKEEKKRPDFIPESE
jgi:hypothetical protein